MYSSPFQKLGKTFLLHRNVSGEYKAVTNCPITLAVVLGGTTGLLLLIGLGLLAAVIVLVNLIGTIGIKIYDNSSRVLNDLPLAFPSDGRWILKRRDEICFYFVVLVVLVRDIEDNNNYNNHHDGDNH